MKQALTAFTMCSYHFCWGHRALREKAREGRWRPRAAVTAASHANHVWPLGEWLTPP